MWVVVAPSQVAISVKWLLRFDIFGKELGIVKEQKDSSTALLRCYGLGSNG